MAWLRLDDGFAEHPKVAALSDEDAWRWVRTLLYCARRRDPELPIAVLKRVLGWDDTGIDWLLELGLIDEHAGDKERVTSYVVHDWHVYNAAKTPAERMSDYRDRKYGPNRVRTRGGKRGAYASDVAAPQTGMAASSVTGVTSDEGNARVTTHARDPQPQRTSTTPTVAKDAADADLDFAPRVKAEEGLSTGIELRLARLLSLLGSVDESKVDYMRGAARRLPESVTAGLIELLEGPDGARVRDRTGYAIGTYRRELEARGL
jgi:hypothetical protein